MIKVYIFRDSQGQINRFSVDGHSGFAPHGQDIVCAAVSAVVQTAVMGLVDIAMLDVMHNQRDGWLECSLGDDVSFNKREKANVILETMLIGLKGIQSGYKKHISIREREV